MRGSDVVIATIARLASPRGAAPFTIDDSGWPSFVVGSVQRVREGILGRRRKAGKGTVEIATQQLDNATLEAQLRLVAELCAAFDASGVNVSYGWACELDIDELYTDHLIESHRLLDFVGESIRRGVFTLGESDLLIHGAGINFSFRLCHEADVHFESPDLPIVNRVVSAWKTGLNVHEVEPTAPPAAQS